MAAAELQALLRFLTQDAKIPLAEAISKISLLRKQGLNTPYAISLADLITLQDVFNDDKATKQVLNAAKRVSNPRKRSASQSSPTQSKRSKTDDRGSQRDVEAELALPTTDLSVEELEKMHVETNRAPLVLAFAVVVQEFTLPNQPLSSRLSLAQAVVSANSQTKAKSIGLISGATAEDEGWAKGQPTAKILNREIAVMRRQTHGVASEEDSQDTVAAEETISYDAFWGLDLEALRKSNGPLTAGKLAGSHGPPIHTPQGARSYLLKSVSPGQPSDSTLGVTASPRKKQSSAEIVAGKEKAAAILLQSIRLLCESWSSTLSSQELDKRAWSWYLSVRPDVAQGQPGWGQRGKVELADILKLRRTT